jgi:SPOR domain
MKVMKLYFFCVMATMLSQGLCAQSVHEDPAVTGIMDRFIEYNHTHEETRGWRIQILSTTDRRTMESMEGKFNRLYPRYKLIFEHQNPFYNLKTGAFLSQQDARPMLKKLQADFPGAFLVTDKFEIAEVLDYLD